MYDMDAARRAYDLETWRMVCRKPDALLISDERIANIAANHWTASSALEPIEFHTRADFFAFARALIAEVRLSAPNAVTEAARAALVTLDDMNKALGPCDHDVNVCQCADLRVADDLRRALAGEAQQ